MVRFKAITLTSGLILCLAAPVTALPLIGSASVHMIEDEVADEAPLPFQPSRDPLADVNAALERAKTGGKLGLVIMGANWCHDSRALITKLEDPELAQTLADKYETILVDVGELEHGKDVIQHFGMPVIYGTPTVLIIDPASGQQINKHDMHQWRDAYKISQEDTTTYFTKMASADTRQTPPAEPESPLLRKLYAEIDAFEQRQSERVYKGFALIGPMITMSRKERPENFIDLWNELRDFRYQITADLETLRVTAREKVIAGKQELSLDFPDYQPFSWEK